MKTSTVGLVLAAILMVLASIGFGIAQAGGNHTDGPVLCCVDQEALEQSDSSSPHALVLPSGIDLEYDADGNPTQGMAQAREAVEAGGLPAESSVNYASNIATEEDVYQGSGFIDTGGNE